MTTSPFFILNNGTGHIAIQLGRKLQWDPETETFPNDPTANRLRARAYREPWGV